MPRCCYRIPIYESRWIHTKTPVDCNLRVFFLSKTSKTIKRKAESTKSPKKLQLKDYK